MRWDGMGWDVVDLSKQVFFLRFYVAAIDNSQRKIYQVTAFTK